MPEENQLGLVSERDKLGAEVMQSFDDVEQTKILQRLHEIAGEEAARTFIVHDLNPRALRRV